MTFALKTYRPLRCNLCWSLLCLLDFFLCLLFVFVTVTFFPFTKYQQRNRSFTVLFGGLGHKIRSKFGLFLLYWVSSYGSYKLGTNPMVFTSTVCCIQASSHGLVVKAGDSWLEGCGFESWPHCWDHLSCTIHLDQ